MPIARSCDSSPAGAASALQDCLGASVAVLTAAIAARDPETGMHCQRVARLAACLARRLGLAEAEQTTLHRMGLVHDVGKIGIDDRILRKSGPLTREEHHAIQRHVSIGVWILSTVGPLSHLLPGVQSHHERFDGAGYPHGLAGEQIPLPARILAVADAFDAMSTGRPYRVRQDERQLVASFRDGSGRQWDPRVVAVLLAGLPELERLRRECGSAPGG